LPYNYERVRGKDEPKASRNNNAMQIGKEFIKARQWLGHGNFFCRGSSVNSGDANGSSRRFFREERKDDFMGSVPPHAGSRDLFGQGVA
jgi:hypothetical protein